MFKISRVTSFEIFTSYSVVKVEILAFISSIVICGSLKLTKRLVNALSFSSISNSLLVVAPMIESSPADRVWF